MTFRDNLNRVCKEKGTTLTRMCKELGISTSKVTAINRGSLPSEEMLLAFSQYLRCSVMDFFSDEGTTFEVVPADDDEEELIEGYRALSRQKKHRLMAYLYELQESSEES
ncbi:helix-turn-helix domain-containing protein [Stomatobaculum longum]|uniref:helix-turn-helix domain-containing protein n=1 Tax=Stomatobaculum longum TaxID=796942 RepID=UPI0028D0B000|nr:helix-turn-helix transcriptional regulator [Stomatobaculum longum]